jgi:hypothetical protein
MGVTVTSDSVRAAAFAPGRPLAHPVIPVMRSIAVDVPFGTDILHSERLLAAQRRESCERLGPGRLG